MSAPRLGVYVHFPWCRHLCPYCDFPVAVAAGGAIPHDEYLAAILAELDERGADYAGRQLVSIYFGGGTPSLWRTDCLAAVIDAVKAAFGAGASREDEGIEVTLEANPSDCTEDLMAQWRAIGINRLSIGVQSMAQTELVALGRDHRMGDGAEAVRAALATGSFRVSADAIFGIPGSLVAGGPAPIAESPVAMAELGPGHLSVYELTIEERTAFGRARRQGRLVALDDDILAEGYTAVHRALTSRGYEHYEISSYARTGQRSIHNQLYWRGAEYLGLGNGAASFRYLSAAPPARSGEPPGAERVTNFRSVKRYMSGGDRIASQDVLDREEMARELLWLGMRTADGVPRDALKGRPALREWLLGEALAELRGGSICPTLKGFLYCDRIAYRVVSASG